MTYYDPLTPTVEATRFQIQRSISALQEKLRQRRELDMDIEYLRNEELERRCELANYHRDIPNRLLYTGMPPRSLYGEDRYWAERSRYAMQEEEKQLTHAHRLRELQLEQMQLDKQKLRSTVAFFGSQPRGLEVQHPYSFNRNNQYISYDDDAALLRKYQDGTRAQEIENQLKSYSNSRSGMKNSHQLQRQPLSRPLASEFKPDHELPRSNHYKSAQKPTFMHNQFSTIQQRSPYAKLNYETDKKGEIPLSIFKNQGIRSPPKDDRPKDDRPKDERPKDGRYNDERHNDEEQDRPTFDPSNKKRARSKSFKQFNVSRQNWTNNSMLNKAYKPKSGRKNSQKSPLKISAISGLQRSRNGNLSLEQAANLKIKNRLKVSQIIFEDSKFRNIKHETSHLQMTFENQLKMRKQIKDKINNHPVVLRKHAMVVE